jgi:hypothetical protein
VNATASPTDFWVDTSGRQYPRHGDLFPYECQLAALASGYARHAHRAAWLLTVDMDEFVFPNPNRQVR